MMSRAIGHYKASVLPLVFQTFCQISGAGLAWLADEECSAEWHGYAAR